jgi:hypothetical protein
MSPLLTDGWKVHALRFVGVETQMILIGEVVTGGK